MRLGELRPILAALRAGEVDVDEVLEALSKGPFRLDGSVDLTPDHHRELRQGFGEAVLAEGKSPDQVVRAVRSLTDGGRTVLVTRLSREGVDALRSAYPEARINEIARTAIVGTRKTPRDQSIRVVVVTAGTSDVAVAAEAVETLTWLGLHSEMVNDVGVAGIHRLLPHIDTIRKARVVVVVAGMEAALPSVVGGLTGQAVIGVPTSVGYGVGEGGYVALAGMLCSCAAGITVVNIDNGFGAAMAAARIIGRGAGHDFEPGPPSGEQDR